MDEPDECIKVAVVFEKVKLSNMDNIQHLTSFLFTASLPQYDRQKEVKWLGC